MAGRHPSPNLPTAQDIIRRTARDSRQRGARVIGSFGLPGSAPPTWIQLVARPSARPAVARLDRRAEVSCRTRPDGRRLQTAIHARRDRLPIGAKAAATGCRDGGRPRSRRAGRPSPCAVSSPHRRRPGATAAHGCSGRPSRVLAHRWSRSTDRCLSADAATMECTRSCPLAAYPRSAHACRRREGAWNAGPGRCRHPRSVARRSGRHGNSRPDVSMTRRRLPQREQRLTVSDDAGWPEASTHAAVGHVGPRLAF